MEAFSAHHRWTIAEEIRMCSFGPPPESKVAPLSYPGISGKKFNPVEAQRVYAESVRKEKEGRYVHSYLDAYGKLGLDENWANDASRGDGLMPDYESLSGVYAQLGWQVLASGRVVPPDPKKIVRRGKKPKERKSAWHQREAGSIPSSLARSASDPSLGGSIPGKQSVPQRRHPKAKATMRSREPSATAHKSNVVLEDSMCVEDMLKVIKEKKKAKPQQFSTWWSRARQQTASPAVIPSARHLPRPETLLVQAVLRKNASAPSFATSKRAAERYGVSR